MSRIWVFGSAAWDIVYQVDAFPVPGGIEHGTLIGRRPGGSSANVARALSSAGHEVSIVASVADDALGRGLCEELQSWGLDITYVDRKALDTPESLIFLDSTGERTIFVVCTTYRPGSLPPSSLLRKADCVYVGDYSDYDSDLVDTLRNSDLLVVTGFPTQARWFAQIVIASESDIPADSKEDPFSSCTSLIGPGFQCLVMTAGRRGARVFSHAGCVGLDTKVVRQVDSTGAGDCFAAGFIQGLLMSYGYEQAAELGAAWAAHAVRSPHSVPPPWSEVRGNAPTA